ncbi:transposable element Tcb1 transposase [Trichonephila clavipes]|nr:transposable element Tcb1 transposase [Trichonephila clavipes]
MLPKEFHQLKYEDINVRQGSVRLVKKTQERKSSTCYLITKGVTSSSPSPLKTRHLEVSEELRIFQSVISRLCLRFEDDGNLSRCYSKGRPELKRRMRTGIYLVVTAKRNRRSTAPGLFSLQSDSRQTEIWRAPTTRYHQENTIEQHRYGGAGWLIWGGIILGSRTHLHVQSVTMTVHIYSDVILEQHVRLFRGDMGAEFLFMHDNARPHRVNIVDECLQSEDITLMDWPAYSPDINLIEHVWVVLGRRIAARQPPPTCLTEFWRALLDQWCNIPQDQIHNLILSMPRRCKVCIASSGRHTPYYPSF